MKIFAVKLNGLRCVGAALMLMSGLAMSAHAQIQTNGWTIVLSSGVSFSRAKLIGVSEGALAIAVQDLDSLIQVPLEDILSMRRNPSDTVFVESSTALHKNTLLEARVALQSGFDRTILIQFNPWDVSHKEEVIAGILAGRLPDGS